MRRPVLYLIPGHIGKEPQDVGAVSPAGWCEAVLAGQVASAVGSELARHQRPHVIDAAGSYAERGARADAAGASLVVHIHADASAAEDGPDRASVFYWPGSARGRSAAERAGQLLAGVVPWPVRVTPAEDLHWLRNVRALLGACRAPAIVVELGFTDGRVGRGWLPAHVQAMAAALSEVDDAAG